MIEVDYGEWRGAELKELGKLPEWQGRPALSGTFRFPAGESLRQTQQRAAATL